MGACVSDGRSGTSRSLATSRCSFSHHIGSGARVLISSRQRGSPPSLQNQKAEECCLYTVVDQGPAASLGWLEGLPLPLNTLERSKEHIARRGAYLKLMPTGGTLQRNEFGGGASQMGTRWGSSTAAPLKLASALNSVLCSHCQAVRVARILWVPRM